MLLPDIARDAVWRFGCQHELHRFNAVVQRTNLRHFDITFALRAPNLRASSVRTFIRTQAVFGHARAHEEELVTLLRDRVVSPNGFHKEKEWTVERRDDFRKRICHFWSSIENDGVGYTLAAIMTPLLNSKGKVRGWKAYFMAGLRGKMAQLDWSQYEPALEASSGKRLFGMGESACLEYAIWEVEQLSLLQRLKWPGSEVFQ